MEAVEYFEVVAAVTWGELKLDVGEVVSQEDLGSRGTVLLDFGAVRRLPVETLPAISYGHLN